MKLSAYSTTFGAVALLLISNAFAEPAPMNLARLHSAVGKLSVPFVANAGQWDSSAAFAAQTFTGTLFVTTAGELVYALPRKSVEAPNPPAAAMVKRAADRSHGLALTETFVGGHANPQAGVPHATNVSRFVGDDPAQHRALIRTFENVALGEVFAGVDVRLRATGSNVEKIFTVRPHQDPAKIQLALRGADRIALGQDGSLRVTTSEGELAFTPPVAYQTLAGRQTPVAVTYALAANNPLQYGFNVGTYDPGQPLIIDPLLQATYFGGTGGEGIYTIAVHPTTGEVLVAGQTNSTDIPCGSGGCGNGPSIGIAFGTDGFVARLNASLTVLLQVTYLGGPGNDYINKLTVHPVSGEVLVAGYAEGGLPCTTVAIGCANGAQTMYGGKGDGFVARLSADLHSVLQATYLGGSELDYINAIAVHPVSGDVLVAGGTASGNLPCTVAGSGCGNGAQSANAGGTDAFVARFNANLTQLRQTTYFGGAGNDSVDALAVHPSSGEVLVGGATDSADLPCTVAGNGCGTGAQTAKSGIHNGFLVRLNADLTSLRQATYFGGSGNDFIDALVVHPLSGEVLIAGYTTSNNLPCATAGGGCGNGAQRTLAGGVDGFVARLNASLTSLLQTTYFGGTGSEYAFALAVHPVSGDVLIGGATDSTDLPCTNAGGLCRTGIQPSNAGSTDGFVARLDASLTNLLQATYFGGTGNDNIFALAVHPVSRELLAAGATISTDLPCTTAGNGCANGAQTANAGDSTAGLSDGFIARFSADLAAPGHVVPNIAALDERALLALALGLGLIALATIRRGRSGVSGRGKP